jgi:hypothetical protein
MKADSYGAVHPLDDTWKLNKLETGLETHEHEEVSNESKYSHYSSLRNLLLLLGVVFIVATVSLRQSSNYSMSSMSLYETTAMSITVSNEYGDITTTKYPYSWLEGAFFAENYKSNSFTISNTRNECSYYYSISGVSSSVSTYSSSGEATDGVFTFTPTTCGEYSLTVNEICNEATSRTLTSSVYVKYVRREISSLSDADREAFLDAYKVLWDVSTTEGQSIYGEKYKGLYHFAVIHNDAGSSPVKDCDEFHGNSGFINNHVMFGAYLEQSLQMINPAVALHYMAYISYFSSDDFDTRKLESVSLYDDCS